METDVSFTVQIDEFNLDKECIRLPSDYLKAANQAADARKDVDELKNEMEVVDADCSKKIRNDPSLYGLEKITEAAVRNVIVLSKKYQAVVSKLNEAKHRLELAQALVSAMEHKKRALTMLVELHGMSYFAEVRPSQRGKEAQEKMTQGRVRRK